MIFVRVVSTSVIVLTLALTGCWRSMGTEETSATCYARVDCLPGEDCEEGLCTCNPDKCEGCCGEDNRCYNGESDDACGLGGGPCQQCVGEDCSEGGVCLCDPTECEGCCGEDDRCHIEQAVDLCGLGGDECLQCEDFQMCSDGACVCDPDECTGDYMCSDGGCVCNPDTCGGCCTAIGICRHGNSDNACGHDGVNCQRCSTGEECAEGVCEEVETCVSECDVEGHQECVSELSDPKFRVCHDNDLDGCLKWRETSCEDDEDVCVQEGNEIDCVEIPCLDVSDPCDESQYQRDQHICRGNTSFYCGMDESGCFSWQWDRDCDDESFCLGGACTTCEAQVGNQCDPDLSEYPRCDPDDTYSEQRCDAIEIEGTTEECTVEVSSPCLSSDEICRDTASGPVCEDECPVENTCLASDVICMEDGSEQVRRCQNFERQNGEACWMWGAAEPCDPDNSEVVCREDVCCEDVCSEGDTQCDSYGWVRECADLNGDGCFEWESEYYSCPEGFDWVCQYDECVEACDDWCPEGTMPFCDDPIYSPIRYICDPVTNTSGEVLCWNWEEEDCSTMSGGDYCLAGHCLGCPDSMDSASACREYGLGYIDCMYDGDLELDKYRECVETNLGCLLWSSWKVCFDWDDCRPGDGGMAEVGCQHECESDCTEEGVTRCSGEASMQICAYSEFSTPDDCLTWSDPLPCSTGWSCEVANSHCSPY